MIEDILRNFDKTIELLLPELNRETDELVEYIKREKGNYFLKKEINDVEYLKTFDNYIEFQLDYLTTPYTKTQFNKVLYYWNELNPESAENYKKLYEELYD